MEDPTTGLLSALFSIFLIIFIGYLLGRMNWVASTTQSGVGQFLARLALPALVFQSMATIDLR
jgi:predicted permease